MKNLTHVCERGDRGAEVVPRRGAFELYWPMKLEDLPQFWKKDTFSRLHEGRSWGEADGEGATFGIHGRGAF